MHNKPLSEMATHLLSWYDQNAREMPWRSDPTPYHVWISEIMLQQTRVAAATPYFQRFIKTLPNIEALANADESQLLKLWEGLGYYSRVRNLQKAAKLVVAEHDGHLPASADGLSALPGIGPYTAGAISSIAFGQCAPAIDGNVMRIFSRIFGLYDDISLQKTKRELGDLSLEMMPPDRPGDFNQALMELGATVCLPNSAPLCSECPVLPYCYANKNNCTTELPVKPPKMQRTVSQKTVFVIVHGNRALLHKRTDKGVLFGMWEFINHEGILDEPAIKKALVQFSVKQITPLKPAKHIFTHLEWRMNGYLIEVNSAKDLPGCHWVTLDQITREYALPSAFKVYQNALKIHLY